MMIQHVQVEDGVDRSDGIRLGRMNERAQECCPVTYSTDGVLVSDVWWTHRFSISIPFGRRDRRHHHNQQQQQNQIKDQKK